MGHSSRNTTEYEEFPSATLPPTPSAHTPLSTSSATVVGLKKMNDLTNALVMNQISIWQAGSSSLHVVSPQVLRNSSGSGGFSWFLAWFNLIVASVWMTYLQWNQGYPRAVDGEFVARTILISAKFKFFHGRRGRRGWRLMKTLRCSCNLDGGVY